MSQAEIEAQIRGCVRDAIDGPRGMRGLVAAIKAHVPGAIVTLEDKAVTVDTHSSGELVHVTVPFHSGGYVSGPAPRILRGCCR